MKKFDKHGRAWLLAVVCSVALCGWAQTDDLEGFRSWAPTPPMGWNSWDCYYSSVNEQLVVQNAEYMRDHLKQFGWEYVVVDIRWYANHPSLGGGNYNQTNPDCVLDEYGRYLPSPRRFPSVMVNGKNMGFKALADNVHAMGLKFGIHIMRGLPKYILDNPTAYKLKGSEDTDWSLVYTSKTPACTWLQDNLTVRNNQYGQLYYNSIVDLYAEWGVDFIKVDDIARPFYVNEIRMLRNAIDQCGRPIVLSLSPGKTQLTYVNSCQRYANMWRMMDDLWDNWSSVQDVFAEADAWSKYHQTGNYADCDMLPLGQICMTVADAGYTTRQNGHWTNLTHAEQYTMMTLWGICHSPLFFGGELTRNDDFTNNLLTNEDYLHMHAVCQDSKQLSRQNGQIVWTAIDPATQERYLAMFSTELDRTWVDYSTALYTSPIIRTSSASHQANVEITLPAGTTELALVVDDGGDNWNYDHGDWINPTFVSAGGYEVPVTGSFVKTKYTNSYYNVIRENTNVYGSGKMTVQGVVYDKGFASDANSMMLVSVPDTIVGFKAICAADDSGTKQSGSTTSVRFLLYDHNPCVANGSDQITVDLTQLGYESDETVGVYDVWAKHATDDAIGSITAEVPAHGAVLYRLSPPQSVDAIDWTEQDKTNKTKGIYNMNGQKVDFLQKGLFIINGRKVFVK